MRHLIASNPQDKPPHNYGAGYPYCSDPNCEYCKELRKAYEEEVKKQSSGKVSAA